MSRPENSEQSFSPIEVKLESGKKYYWCTCGKSSNQPFCDGSHKGTEYTPRVFNINESKKVWLCTCKKTGNAPFCDGTHTKL